MASKQNTGKIDEWQAQNVDRITIKPRKELALPEMIQKAVDRGFATSRQDYIIKAVLEALDRDGVFVDSTDGV